MSMDSWRPIYADRVKVTSPDGKVRYETAVAWQQIPIRIKNHGFAQVRLDRKSGDKFATILQL